MSFLLVQLKYPYSHQQYINVILSSTTRMTLFTSTIYINVILISTTKMSLFTSTIYKCHS